jgi:heme-degrading monooxygenase HmoA
MYASILRGDREGVSGDVDTLWKQVMEQPGLVVAYVLVNAEDLTDGMVLSIWESEEAFNAYAVTDLRIAVEATGALDRTNYYVLRATI